MGQLSSSSNFARTSLTGSGLAVDAEGAKRPRSSTRVLFCAFSLEPLGPSQALRLRNAGGVAICVVMVSALFRQGVIGVIDLPVMTFAEVEASLGPFSCRVVVRSAAKAR